MGCSNTDSEPNGLPEFYDIFFEFSDSDEFGYGDIQYAAVYKAENGQLKGFSNSGEIEWLNLSLINNEVYGYDLSDYGTIFGYITVAGSEKVDYKEQPLSFSRYWLFKFPDSSLDTLNVEVKHHVDTEGQYLMKNFIIYYNNKVHSSYDTIPQGIENNDQIPGPYFFYENNRLVLPDDGFGETLPWIISIF